MARNQVERPISGPAAFATSGESAAWSQAAILLAVVQRVSPVREGVRLEGREAPDALAEEGGDEFPLPDVRPTADRAPAEAVRQRLSRRYGAMLDAAAPGDALAELAEALYREPGVETAAALADACLRHDHELVRVAAAALHFELSTDPLAALGVVAAGLESDDPLTVEVAATLLARLDPTHPRLLDLTGGAAIGGIEPVHTSLLVHGTWARTASWWQPGGDFHTYVLNNVRPDLYAGGDRFDWSGGYSDAARAAAAVDLVSWVNAHGASGLDLFAHSHGANAAMLATQHGLQAGMLVLLSCPVHPSKYAPDFNHVSRVVSVRVRMDLVILADRGGQRFRDPRIHENILPLWFDHGASHDPDVWQQHNVPAMV